MADNRVLSADITGVDEQAVVCAIRAGDAGVLEDLFCRYYQDLFDFCRRITSAEDIAEDIIQEVFLRIWKNRHALNPQSSVKRYLFKAVKNLSYQHIRNTSRRHSLLAKMILHDAQRPATPEETVEYDETREVVEQAVNTLPKRCREIFLLSRELNIKNADIADALHLSVRTVETQISIALKKIYNYCRVYYEE